MFKLYCPAGIGYLPAFDRRDYLTAGHPDFDRLFV